MHCVHGCDFFLEIAGSAVHNEKSLFRTEVEADPCPGIRVMPERR
jgi:hypothetical protein